MKPLYTVIKVIKPLYTVIKWWTEPPYTMTKLTKPLYTVIKLMEALFYNQFDQTPQNYNQVNQVPVYSTVVRLLSTPE